ncbi:MAG: hypothetical protein NXI24_24795 [bacterium]|nr:hypothetical protein [bacterium]
MINLRAYLSLILILAFFGACDEAKKESEPETKEPTVADLPREIRYQWLLDNPMSGAHITLNLCDPENMYSVWRSSPRPDDPVRKPIEVSFISLDPEHPGIYFADDGFFSGISWDSNFNVFADEVERETVNLKRLPCDAPDNLTRTVPAELACEIWTSTLTAASVFAAPTESTAPTESDARTRLPKGSWIFVTDSEPGWIQIGLAKPPVPGQHASDIEDPAARGGWLPAEAVSPDMTRSRELFDVPISKRHEYAGEDHLIAMIVQDDRIEILGCERRSFKVRIERSDSVLEGFLAPRPHE